MNADGPTSLAAETVLRQLAEEPDTRPEVLTERTRAAHPLMDVASIEHIVARAGDRARGLGAIVPLLDDDTVTDVMINGPGVVWVDRGERPEPTSVRLGAGDITVLIERMLQPLGLQADRLRPLVDARLSDGSRVNVVMPPLAPDGPTVTIRRFRAAPVPLSAFGPPDLVDLLHRLVGARATLLVVGGTGAGKTTLLNALGGVIPAPERIVTVEDTAELRLPGDHVIRLEGREANSEGVGEVTMRSLVRNAMRMRPDRIVVGEVRGGEAFDLLLALNTGHDGSMATCHADDPVGGLRRLETLALLGGVDLPHTAVREHVVAAVDVIVHVVRRQGRRSIASVAEVDPDSAAVRTLWPTTLDEPRRLRVSAAFADAVER